MTRNGVLCRIFMAFLETTGMLWGGQVGSVLWIRDDVVHHDLVSACDKLFTSSKVYFDHDSPYVLEPTLAGLRCAPARLFARKVTHHVVLRKHLLTTLHGSKSRACFFSCESPSVHRTIT
jgi:hypothetical protein